MSGSFRPLFEVTELSFRVSVFRSSPTVVSSESKGGISV